MRVLSARFTVGILKSLAGIALAGLTIVFLRDLLADIWQIAIPPLLYAMLIPAVIMFGLWEVYSPAD